MCLGFWQVCLLECYTEFRRKVDQGNSKKYAAILTPAAILMP